MLAEKSFTRISPKALRYWQTTGMIFSIIFSIVVVLVYLLFFKQWYILPSIVVVIALACFVFPIIEYKQWAYLIELDRVEIIHGIFSVERTVIPINRIQHVKLEQGLIQKYFDLSDVTIYTAGSVQKIEALHTKEAKLIVERISTAVINEDGDISEKA